MGKQAAGRRSVGQDHLGAAPAHPELAGEIVEHQGEEAKGPLDGPPDGRAVNQRMAQDGEAPPPHRVGVHAEELVVHGVRHGMPERAVLLGGHPGLGNTQQLRRQAGARHQGVDVQPALPGHHQGLCHEVDRYRALLHRHMPPPCRPGW